MAKKTFEKASTQIMGKASEQKKHSEEGIINQLIILPELETLIPALTRDEFEQLRQNIRAEGCREPLLVWQDGDNFVLVDGHNRYKICRELGKDFRISLLEFPSLDEAKDWMINNQLGKRNVTDHVKSYLRGLQYNREKSKAGVIVANLPQEDAKPPQRTNERLAEQHKVSAKTIERDEKFALGLDKLTEGDKSLKTKILNKEISINKSLIESLAGKPQEEIQRIRESIEAGGTPDETHKKQEQEIAYKNLLKKLGLAIQNKSKDEAKMLLKSLSDTIENL